MQNRRRLTPPRIWRLQEGVNLCRVAVYYGVAMDEDAFSRSVPTRFHYLKDVAKVFGLTLLSGSEREDDRWQSAFDPADIARLRAACDEFSRRDDAQPLQEWIGVASRGKPWEKKFASRLTVVVTFFQLLQDEPLDILRQTKTSELSFERLPTDLAYLAAAAREYGHVRSEQQALRLLECLSAEKQNELRSVASRVLEAKDYPRASRVIEESEDAAAHALYNLFMIMDLAGLDFD